MGGDVLSRRRSTSPWTKVHDEDARRRSEMIQKIPAEARSKSTPTAVEKPKVSPEHREHGEESVLEMYADKHTRGERKHADDASAVNARLAKIEDRLDAL